MDKIYTVTITQYEWGDIIEERPFSSLQKAIEFSNAYGTYKTEDISRCFEDDEGYDEMDWQIYKTIIATYTRPDRTYDYHVCIHETQLDDFSGLDYR